MRNDDKRVAKRLLADTGIKVFQKDIKSVIFENKKVVRHGLAGGAIEPDYFTHKENVIVEIKNGKKYILERETVDEYGNYSEGSALFVTRSVKES